MYLKGSCFGSISIRFSSDPFCLVSSRLLACHYRFRSGLSSGHLNHWYLFSSPSDRSHSFSQTRTTNSFPFFLVSKASSISYDVVVFCDPLCTLLPLPSSTKPSRSSLGIIPLLLSSTLCPRSHLRPFARVHLAAPVRQSLVD